MISHEEARQQAQGIVAKMTLDEKIKQINFRAPSIDRLGITDYNYWNEGLHGVARAGVATVFPQAIGLAAMFDEEQLEEVAAVISEEGRAKYNQYHAIGDNDIYKGLTYWSPNINIFRDPRWGRGQETYGEDPFLTARLGVAFIKGLQGDGKYMKLAACAKHFAVHSGPEADRHSFDAIVSDKDLYETYLPAFEASVKEADVESFMGAYNAVNGIPACVHPRLLGEILREEWNFKGHVVSDYGALEDVFMHHKYVDTPEETMALAMKIGCNLCAGNISDALFAAVEQELVTEEEITESVVSLYTTRVRLGMFADDNEYDQIPYEQIDCHAHQVVNEEAAKKAIVLLKNEQFLPLNKAQLSSIAVVGPNANSIQALQGNYFGTSSTYSTFLKGIQDNVNAQTRVYYALGSHLYNDHAESSLSRTHERESEALIAVKHADCVLLCLGLDPTIEGEQGDSGNVYGSGDKPDVFLPQVQQQLLEKVLELGKPVILAIAAGSAISLNGLETHDNLKAIFHTWYPGSMGGKVLAEMIFGDVSPSGKLPVTFYKTTENLPDFSDYTLKNRTYRYIEEEPLYPFGFGLTYSPSTVQFVDIKPVDEGFEVLIQIDNEGAMDSQDVVQLYGKTDSPLDVRNEKLVAFKRVHLAKGASQQISLYVPSEKLHVVTEQGQLVADGTTATFYVATNGMTQEVRLSGEKTKRTITLS